MIIKSLGPVAERLVSRFSNIDFAFFSYVFPCLG